MVKPMSQAGSRLPRIVTRLTGTSSGKFTCSQGRVPLAAASFLAENHDVSMLSSMAFPGGQPGQVELAVIRMRARYFLISQLLLSVVTGGTSFSLTRPGPSMMNTGSFGVAVG